MGVANCGLGVGILVSEICVSNLSPSFPVKRLYATRKTPEVSKPKKREEELKIPKKPMTSRIIPNITYPFILSAFPNFIIHHPKVDKESAL